MPVFALTSTEGNAAGSSVGSSVVVVDKIDGILVDVAEQLAADVVEPRLRVARRRPRHIARIEFAEVALGINVRMQKRLIPTRQAHHRVVDRAVAVRIQLHRLPDDVRTFRARGAEQIHFIHGVKQLPVRGLEAVDFRDRARHDDAHRVRHKVLPYRVIDILLDDLARTRDKALHLRRTLTLWLLSFSCHNSLCPPLCGRNQETSRSSRYSLPCSAM